VYEQALKALKEKGNR